MPKPTKAQICTDVVIFISKFANYPVDKIEQNYVLKGNPLKMDSAQLNYLALALRGYVKNHNPNETVLAVELKKSGLTITLLCALIYKKIKG